MFERGLVRAENVGRGSVGQKVHMDAVVWNGCGAVGEPSVRRRGHQRLQLRCRSFVGVARRSKAHAVAVIAMASKARAVRLRGNPIPVRWVWLVLVEMFMALIVHPAIASQ